MRKVTSLYFGRTELSFSFLFAGFFCLYFVLDKTAGFGSRYFIYKKVSTFIRLNLPQAENGFNFLNLFRFWRARGLLMFKKHRINSFIYEYH